MEFHCLWNYRQCPLPLFLPFEGSPDVFSVSSPSQPEDNILKPTTLFYHTDQTTGIILTHELVVDLLFQSTGPTEDERLMVATLYRQPCTISRFVYPLALQTHSVRFQLTVDLCTLASL